MRRRRGRRRTPVVVDLYDRPAVVSLLSDADGAPHASPGDENSADLDSAVVDAAIEAFDGTGKPYLHITGAWVYGANPSITEESPIDAPAMVAWKEPIAQRLSTRATCGDRHLPGVAYGDGGGGVPGLLLGSPRDDAGNLIMLGTGRQHWATVHVADLAESSGALEDDSARGHYVIGDGLNPTVAELTEAAAVAAGAPELSPAPTRRDAPGRLLRRSPAARSGHRCGQGEGRARLVPSHPGSSRVPQRELPQATDERLTNGTRVKGTNIPDRERSRGMTTAQEYLEKRWTALILLCVAQFIVVLEYVDRNVALPSIGKGLDFSEENLPWIVNAYVIAFGGFLLLGGRAADLLGRRRIFIAGLGDGWGSPPWRRASPQRRAS